jgi:formylmethanofuran--tetrahydromethanopterin N-formyltransferase
VRIGKVEIRDTFAEAFDMWGARLVITGRNRRWAREGAWNVTGFATSVIGCKCEAGIERELAGEETPDGRPGFAVLLFAFSADDVEERLVERIGQSILTCPTTACFDGLPDAERRVEPGGQIRYFGDRYQISKLLDGRRLWRVPVMEGEFVVEEAFGVQPGVAGGNFLILARDGGSALDAAERAVDAMRPVPSTILPFPGGVVRSGSKVGSRAYEMNATTNERYCPTLRAMADTALPENVGSVLEIVVNGLAEEPVAASLRAGVRAACGPGVVAIDAGNYGGDLGDHHFHLHEILDGDGDAG